MFLPPPRANNGTFQDLNSLIHSLGALRVKLKAANGSPASVSAPHWQTTTSGWNFLYAFDNNLQIERTLT